MNILIGSVAPVVGSLHPSLIPTELNVGLFPAIEQPVRVARTEAGIKVGVINPHRAKYRSRRLQGTFFKQLRPNVLGQCQLPETLHDSEGSVTKPARW